MEIRQPQLFKKAGIEATVQPQILVKADLVVLRMIHDAFPDRPIYFSRTAGGYPQSLGLGRYLLSQGLARKLLPEAPTSGRDTLLIPGEGFLDVKRTQWLWANDFEAPTSLAARNGWVDRASVGIPYLYIASAATLAEAEQRLGNSAEADSLVADAKAIAKATGLEDLFTPPPLQPQPAVPLTGESGAVPLGDSDTSR
jgi:hypothetical protein